jgi:hypothetical protein
MTSLEQAFAAGGVYAIDPAQAADADARARDAGLAVHLVDAAGEPFDGFARALSFPGWFGRNWDALEDALADLSWLPAARGRVLLVHRVAATSDAATLLDVLATAAEGADPPLTVLVAGGAPGLPAAR